MGHRIGVDIGGSFTDFAILDEATREVRALKVFSRPDQPGQEVVAGLSALSGRYGITPEQITYFTHGTTVGVNTVIQRRGLRLALFTTEHFSDVLELGRLKLPNMYDLLSKRPEPLIPRDLVFGIAERLTADGAVQTAPCRRSVAAALDRARSAGAEGIVVAFLHSYRNAAHEQAVMAMIREAAPGLPVFASAEVWPIIREFERTMTAVIGGYVQPRVATYLTELQAALRAAGVRPEARLTKSNGGVMTAEQGKRDCVQMILSGTAAGVIGASYVAAMCGIAECMSLDIGGTSADVALIVDGQPQYGVGETIGDYQIHIPSVSVTSIGEGGGSIAWVDDLGVLKVGPQSAGSTPGPACFSRGGTQPTITDAFAVCGIVGQAGLGYDAVSVDVGRARAAVASLSGPLGESVEATAEAIIQIAVSGMYAKVSSLVTRFGIDPRTMALLAFGGAGPMLGASLAHALDMPETVIPTTPGVLSALGGLIADLRNDFIQTLYLDLDHSCVGPVQQAFAGLRERAVAWLRVEQGHEGEARIVCSADMRYRGQSYELEAILPEDAIEAGDLGALGEAFHAAHERIYDHADRAAPIQLVNVRLLIAGATPKPLLPRIAPGDGPAVPDRLIPIWSGGASRMAGLYRRAALRGGQTFAGPAIVTQDDTTSFVPPGCQVRVDEFGNLRLRQLVEGHA